MLNRLKGLLSVFCLILILASCSKKVENKQLLRAEILMHSSVDSSYQILQSISPDILTKSEQMHYGLLLAETMDKKYLSLFLCLMRLFITMVVASIVLRLLCIKDAFSFV